MTDKRKRILLIGATGGVGEALGQKLVSAGYEVLATCRSAAQRETLERNGGYARVLELDLGSMQSIETAFAELAAAGIDTLDAVANCAAINPATPMEIVDFEEVQRIFQTNLFGTLRAVQLAIPMLRRTRGRIVLVGSLASSYVMPMLGVYSASKFALDGACDALRRELYPWGIHVSLVSPGGIKTRMFFGHLEDVDRKLASLQGNATLYRDLYRAHARVIPMTQPISVPRETVADDVMRALTARRPKARYFSGIHSKITRFLTRILPDSWFDLFSRKLFWLKKP